MEHSLPEQLDVLTEPARLWEMLEVLPLRLTIIERDPDGAVHLVSADVTGRREPLVHGSGQRVDLRRLFHARYVERLAQALAGGRAVPFRDSIEMPDGSIRVVDGCMVPLSDTRLLTMTYNLTERVAAVERAHRYTQAILAASPDRYWVVGRDLVIRHAEGSRGRRGVGGSAERGLADLFPPDAVDRFAREIEVAIGEDEMRTVVAEATFDPGRWYETRIVPLGDDVVLLAARDVTGYRRDQATAARRAAIDAVSSRAFRDLYDLVGEPFVAAAERALGEVAEVIGADTATLGRRLDDETYERLLNWTRTPYVHVAKRIPRVVALADLPAFFRGAFVGDAIVARSVDPDALGSIAHFVPEPLRARSVLIVPLQSDEDLAAYLSFYWLDAPMPDVEPILASLRSLGVNLLGAARRSEAEAARAEATENLERALAALRVNEERFRLVSRATNDVLWDWDLTTDTLWWGDGITTVFGYGRSELDPTIASWERLIHPDDAAEVIGSRRAAISTGSRSWAREYRFAHHRGGYLWVLDRGEIVHAPDGTPVRMVGGMRDVTERRRTESLLRDQARLLDAANDVIYERDLDGRITYWNRAAARTYGWSAEEAVGRHVADLFESDRAAFEAADAQVLRDGEWTGELRQRRADGEELVVEARWSLVTDDHERPRSVLAIGTDVTERRRWEQHLVRAQRMESVGTLAGGIAHDLNNVLTPILLATEMLRAEETDPGRAASLTTIEVAAQRGADLVRRVLSYARGMEGRHEDVAIDGLFAELAAILTETFPRNIHVRIVESTEPLHVAGDPTQLHQVLLNLCVNARDAMPDGGELVVAAQRRRPDDRAVPHGLVGDDVVVITVSDTGSGIPPEIAERIFEPFFTTKAPGCGSGLGLATAMAIVRGHGGVLDFAPRPGGGTVFTVTLPAVGGPVAVAEDPDDPAMPRGRGETVLVVDDEPAILSTLRRALHGHGYRVHTAAGHEDAVRAVSDDPSIAVVVTDLMMPDVDGIDTARAIRDLRPDLPVIAASGVKTEDAVARADAAGIRRFLAKPYSIGVLLVALREVIAEATADAGRG